MELPKKLMTYYLTGTKVCSDDRFLWKAFIGSFLRNLEFISSRAGISCLHRGQNQ